MQDKSNLKLEIVNYARSTCAKFSVPTRLQLDAVSVRDSPINDHKIKSFN